MDDESVSLVACDAFSKLLERPIGGWMSGHVEVESTSAGNFHDHEYIDNLESCRHDDKEVTGYDRFGVVAHERHPALFRVGRTFGRFRHVTPDRAGRNADSDF